MIKEYDSRTGIRFPSSQRKKIDQLIKEGKFKNLSQVIRAALTQFLDIAEGEVWDEHSPKQQPILV